MRSAIDIAAESLVEILPMLQAASIRVVGSEEATDNIVRLIIEGDCVPDAPRVECLVMTTSEIGKATLTFMLTPVTETTPAPPPEQTAMKNGSVDW